MQIAFLTARQFMRNTQRGIKMLLVDVNKKICTAQQEALGEEEMVHFGTSWGCSQHMYGNGDEPGRSTAPVSLHPHTTLRFP